MRTSSPKIDREPETEGQMRKMVNRQHLASMRRRRLRRARAARSSVMSRRSRSQSGSRKTAQSTSSSAIGTVVTSTYLSKNVSGVTHSTDAACRKSRLMNENASGLFVNK